MDCASVIRRSARQYPRHAAVWFEGRQQTYAQLHERGVRLAAALRALGATPGQPVATLGDNAAETVEQAAGCALGNYPRATLYTYHAAPINRYLLELTGACVLIVQARYAALLAPMLGDLPSLRAVLVYGGPVPEGMLDYEQALAAAPADDVVLPVSDSDVHIIRFSSGTTGKPKGIFHTVADWQRYNSEWRWTTPPLDETSRYLVPTSLAHLGVAFLWGTLATGGCIAPMPAFDAARTLELIEQLRITHAVAAPVMIREMVAVPDARSRDLSSLRCLMYAGSPISPATLQPAIDLFGASLYQMYGQSEIAPVSMLLPHQHMSTGTPDQLRRLRSVGRPSASVVVTIRDDDGRELPAGQIGEIAARGPSMSGIWRDPEGTARRILPDGSILTRDMGYIDEDGFIYLVDRKDDMIVSGGYNIWPAELEEVLHQHPAVAEACVFGVPDDKWGETPRAVVALRPGAAATAAELITHCRDAVGGVKKITSVEFVAALPRTSTGKVMRAQLKEPWWKGREGRIAGS